MYSFWSWVLKEINTTAKTLIFRIKYLYVKMLFDCVVYLYNNKLESATMKTPEEKKKLEETAPKFKDFDKPIIVNTKDYILRLL